MLFSNTKEPYTSLWLIDKYISRPAHHPLARPPIEYNIYDANIMNYFSLQEYNVYL